MVSAQITKRIAKDFSLMVDFEAEGGITILFGASGSGKTTTLRAIAGMVRPDSGRIAIGDAIVFDSTERVDVPIKERRVGFVFQQLSLFPHLTARQNVEFGIRDSNRSKRRAEAERMLEAFHVLHVRDRKPSEISGGEAQRVALARALSCKPRILLLDEPLSAIDYGIKKGIIADLKSFNAASGLPIIYVTHSREEAISLGERMIVLENGRVAAVGEPLEVFGAPIAASVARLSGAENIFDGRVISKSDSAGTMTVEISDGSGTCRIDVPFGEQSPGASVRIAVPSGDILLAKAELRGTSARNLLRGVISAIEEQGHRTLVKANAGVSWRVSVTPQAVMEMSLRVGSEAWLAFKTHSCYLLDR